MRVCRDRQAARGPVRGALVAFPLLLVALCGFAGTGERVSDPCRSLDSQPLFSNALERGVKKSGTLQALLAELIADERVTLHFALGDLSPGLRARTRVRITRHRTCRGDCLLRLDAEIVVRWRASPNARIAAAAHELVHLLRLLHGSSDEGRGSSGEIIADRIERRVGMELSADALPPAVARKGPVPNARLLDELLVSLAERHPAGSIRVEQVRYERLVPETRPSARTR